MTKISTPAEFSAKMDRLVRTVPSATRKGVRKGAEAVKLSADLALANDTHGSFVLRGTVQGRRRTARPLRVKARPAYGATMAAWVVEGTPKAQYSWLERGTTQHIVGAGRGARRTGVASTVDTRRMYAEFESKSGSRYRSYNVRKRMRVGPGEIATGPWMVSGARPKHTFSRAVNRVPVAPIVHKEIIAKTLGTVFK